MALAGEWSPLLAFLGAAPVGTLLLEAATARAGELAPLRALPDHLRVGVGVVNQKLDAVEDQALVASRVRRAVDLLGRERALFTPDCGFATFADCPLASAEVAEAKLTVIARAVDALRGGRA